MSVWQTGAAAQRVSRTNPEWRREFEATLPDLDEEDIAGSGFAITAYRVHAALGGDAALARLRERMRRRGLRLMLDFVANHLAPDHTWVEKHPYYFVHGREIDLVTAAQNYRRLDTSFGSFVFAYGRDPSFSGWPDTLQLNYGNPATQEAMLGELLKVAGQCDGVRCDMAMLLLPEIFYRTWGIVSQPFWPRATRRVRESFPRFTFMAEVYWDMEWALQQQGFDYTYDKRLYDRLRAGDARPVREHFLAGPDYQSKLVRFLENHDEPRAAVAFAPDVHEAAAVLTFLAPGLRFFHQGQLEGLKKRVSPHLARAPDEPVDERLQHFYGELLAILRQPAVREGEWMLLECVPAWEGNSSCDAFVAFAWQRHESELILVAVNYAPHSSQCYVHLPFEALHDRSWRLTDLLSDARYDRDGTDLVVRGLYLDVPPWQRQVFEVAAE